MSFKKKSGFLYAVTGEKYISEALVSIRSLRKLSPEADVTIISDHHIECDLDLNISVMEFESEGAGWKNGISYKVEALKRTPYEKTIFMDSDTFFCRPCDELFSLLDFFDLLIAPAPTETNNVFHHNEPLEGYLSYNTGVIAYNISLSLDAFFSDWKRKYERNFHRYPQDQPPFMEALLSHKIKTYLLSPIYNFRLPYLSTVPALEVKILHGRGYNFVETERKINKKLVHRAWHPDKKRIITLKSSSKRYAKIKNYIGRVKRYVVRVLKR